MNTSLISYQNRVESPFIIINIGEYKFGHCSAPNSRNKLKQFDIEYPNYLTGLNIRKVNGSVNMYTIRMTYAITETDDPNFLEKVFSSISNSRKITLEYGDWMLPAYIYKHEEAILTKVSSNVDFNNSKIEYTLTATSNSLSLSAPVHDFEARSSMKPSDRIKELISNPLYGLSDIFYGMKHLDEGELINLIPGDDKEVELKAHKSTSILNYMNYLVSCMVRRNDPETNGLKTTKYYWATYDDISGKYGGPYFKITSVAANSVYNNSYDCYEIDVGYPSNNYVSGFTLDNNESWSILYDYSEQMHLPKYTYDIDSKGNLNSTYSPMITSSTKYGTTTEQSKAWWSTMTQYPISAKITIKGLLKPALLMSYVKVNAYFYGKKHISSGLYIITKQEDSIDNNGYKTILNITRVGGDA